MARTKSPLYINENPSIYTQRQETDGYIREWQSGSFRCQRFKNLYRPRRQGEAHRLFSPPRTERRLVGPIQPGCLVPFFALGRFYIVGGESPSVYAAFQYQLGTPNFIQFLSKKHLFAIPYLLLKQLMNSHLHIW